jgi:hypothetical protein
MIVVTMTSLAAASDPQTLTHQLQKCTKATALFDEFEVESIASTIFKNINFQSNCSFSFVHVPKTGGTSVIGALSRLLGEAGCVPWALQGVFTDSKVTNETVGSLGRKQLRIAPHSAPCSYIHMKSYRKYFPFQGLQLLPAVRSQIPPVRALLGHVLHGGCHYLEEGCCTCTYTTVLRHPVQRLVSHIRWRCWKNKTKPLYDCRSVESFFRKIEAKDPYHLFYGSDNMMVRFLAGVGFYYFNKMIPCREVDKTLCAFPYNGGITNAHLKKAIMNLAHHYPVWGHTDNMASFLRRVSAAYQLPPPGRRTTPAL